MDDEVKSGRPDFAGRRTLSQAVTEAVLERVRSGEFRLGERLPTEKALMAEYDVGRNAVREAIQALVALGLVEVRPGRGATLVAIEGAGMDNATISALLGDEAIDDLYEFRRLLEIEIARRAAERATEDDIRQLESCVAQYRRAHTLGKATNELDAAFHAALARASHNSLYQTMLDAVDDLIRNARRIAERVPWAVDRAVAEHERIVRAVAKHAPDDAAEEMTRHLEGAIEAIQEGRRTQKPSSSTS